MINEEVKIEKSRTIQQCREDDSKGNFSNKSAFTFEESNQSIA